MSTMTVMKITAVPASVIAPVVIGPVVGAPVVGAPVVGAPVVGAGQVATVRAVRRESTWVRRTRPAPARPGRRSGRSIGPVGRPGSGAPAPELRRLPVQTAAACSADTWPRPQRARVRSVMQLTDRGIAVILVAGVMVAIAALTVVSATATRVTSDHYLAFASVSSR